MCKCVSTERVRASVRVSVCTLVNESVSDCLHVSGWLIDHVRARL